MLRRLKIGGRVNMLIAVPLLALIAFAALGYIALQRSSVNGDEYKALKQAQDLRAATVPPPANLLGAWAEVNAIGVIAASAEGFTADGQDAIREHLRNIATAQQNFNTSMAYWSQQQLDQRVRIRLIDIGGDVGTKFFAAINSELKPAIDAKAPQRIIDVIGTLEWRFDLQQSGVQRALEFSNAEVASRETSTTDYVRNVVLYAGAAVLGLLVLTLLLSALVRRSIVRPIRQLAAQAKSVATKDLPEVVQTVQDLPADSAVPHLAAFDLGTHDELADLGAPQREGHVRDVGVLDPAQLGGEVGQRAVVADRAAHRNAKVDVAPRIAPDMQLVGLVTEGLVVQRLLDKQLDAGVFHRTGIDRHLVAHRPQQLVERRVQALGVQVPQRHIDRADRTDWRFAPLLADDHAGHQRRRQLSHLDGGRQH